MSKNICLYAHHDPDNILSEDDINTINILSKNFDKIVIITSNNKEIFSNINVEVVVCENNGLDFGKYEWYIRNNENIIFNYDNICLTNNSYITCREFKKSIEYMKTKKCDWWGYTSSSDKILHIQSYFLFFSKTAFQTYKDLLYQVSPYYNKIVYEDAVQKIELATLKHMNKANLLAGVYLKTHLAFPNIDSSVFNADKLLILNENFPLIKKKCYTKFSKITGFTKEKLLNLIGY